jgi:hypothetical protein
MADIPARPDLTALEKKTAGSSGELDFSNRGLTSFDQIEIPVVTKVLNLSDNNITSFEGFNPPQRLDTLILDGNPLLSFLGFPKLHSLRHFSAKKSPLADLPNFASLTLLCLESGSYETSDGHAKVDDLAPCRLETLNGRAVTVSDRAAVSPKSLAQQFVTRDSFDAHVRPTPGDLRAIVQPLGDALRRGWIADALPRRLEQVAREAAAVECDPVSVRVVRIFGFIQHRQWEVAGLFERLLAPAPPRVQPAVFVGDEWTARAEKQQSLIFQLNSELQELRASQAQAEQARTAAKKKVEAAELSEETLGGYQALLAMYGRPLLENSAKVKSDGRAGKAQQNRDGVRAAVAQLVGAQPGASDAELTRMLRELARSLPSDSESPSLL